jgi:hypothetical protein
MSNCLTVLDRRRDIVPTNLVQETAVADAEQPRSPFSIPASLLQSVIDGVNFGFIAKAS